MKKRIAGALIVCILLLQLIGSALAAKVDPLAVEIKTQSRSDNFSTDYTLTGNGATDILSIAWAQYGRTGSSLGYTEQWCADFVCDCAKLAGESAAIPAYGAVDGLASRIVTAGGYEVSIAEAQPGDICCINWNDGGGVWDHVEIVYAANGSSISTIGGNTDAGSDLYTRKVGIHNPLSNANGNVHKIYRPNYKNAQLAFASTDAKVYAVDTNVTFSFNAPGADSVHLYIYHNGNLFFEGQFAPNATYQRVMPYVGHYSYYLVAHYASGDVESAWDDFQVASAPTVNADKSNYTVGSTATFTIDAPGASSVHLYIYYSGAELFEGEYAADAVYQKALNAAGHYAYYIMAHYDMGDIRTDWGEFQAVEMPAVNADKTVYITGETETFSFTAPLATSLHLYIYKDGQRCFEGQYSPSVTYQTVITELGNYTYYIIGHYPMGDVESAHKEFRVDSANSTGIHIDAAYPMLDEDIDLVYAVTVPAGAQNPYMVFTYQGAEFTVRDYTVNAGGQYCFAFPNITPQCIGETVSATLHAGDAVDTVEGYSIRRYCENMLTNHADDTALVTLLSDLLTYGAAAQTYTGYHTDALVTDGLTLTPSEFAPISGKSVSFSGTADAAADWVSAGLILGSKVAMRFTFTAESVDGLTVNVSLNGREETFNAEDFVSVGNGKYYIDFHGIEANEFDAPVTAAFYHSDAPLGRSLTYTVNAYICGTQNCDNTALRALVRALYNYGASASAYALTN